VIEKFAPLERKGSAWTRAGNLVGNGPFVLKKWLVGQAITVERSPTYWNSVAVRPDAVVFHAVDDSNAEERMFRSGQLDVTNTIPTDKIEGYRRDHPALLRIDPLYGTYFFRVNLGHPPLDDVRVRRALALVIDRDAIVTRILRAGQIPALHFTPPYGDFTPSVTLTPDVNEARRLLAEAGYPEGKDLRRIEFLYNTSEMHKSIAEAVQQMWKTKLGVDVVLRNEEWKVYLDSTNSESYDLGRAGWVGDFADPHDHLNLLSSDGGNNHTGYANPDFDRLLQTALQTRDAGARLDFYRQLDAMVTRDLPVIPIFFYKRVYLLQTRVKNWPAELLGFPEWQYLDLAD
jgi:oligopeptide transport system substrate-binding protein